MLFGRETAERLDDRVWATAGAKMDGICREVLEETAGPGTLAIAVAHEAGTLDALQRCFGDAHIRFVRWETLPSISEFDFERHVGEGTQAILAMSRLAFEARRLVPMLKLGRLFGGGGDNAIALHFIVAERALLPAPDRELMAFAGSLPWRTTLRFHVSMDDPLLRAAVPDRITALMKSLGWDGKGGFSHPSVTDLITVAQKYQKNLASAEKRGAALIGAGRKPGRKATP
jgi:hypothetical protein